MIEKNEKKKEKEIVNLWNKVVTEKPSPKTFPIK